MYLMRCSYTADTGAAQVDTALFLNKEAAEAYMHADFEKEREIAAKYGAAFPEETSRENEEFYTDIDQDEIRVYREGDTMLWEVIKITPQDMPASLSKEPEGTSKFPVDVYSAFADDELANVLHDPSLLADVEEIGEDLAEQLRLDDPCDTVRFQSPLWLPDTVVSRIQVDAIRRFLAGTFKIIPIGYAIADCNGIGLEIERISADCVFDDDEEAVQQAIQDGVKLIPVEELPENFDRKYLGWIDTPDNRQRIQEYCSRLKK